MYDLTRNQTVFAVLMIVAAGALASLHWAATSLTCTWDTSYCVYSTERTGVYEGTLRTFDGGLFRTSEFEVAFESRRDSPRVTFRTDERGRYCIVWARERTVPFVIAASGQGLSSTEEKFPGLTGWRDLEGRPPPPGCQESDEDIPWNRAENASSTWQFWLLMLLPLAALVALASALVNRGQRHAPRLLASGALLVGIDLVAGAVLWGVP